MSLDGFIAGPKGEANWITPDPNFDWRSLFAQFDTIVVGRKTFEPMAAAGRTTMPGIKTIVFSRTLRPEEYPDVRIVAENELKVLAALKASAGKDIWLFGGGALFRSLAEANWSIQLKFPSCRYCLAQAYLWPQSDPMDQS